MFRLILIFSIPPFFRYELQANSIYPSTGSTNGGTSVIITGSGFGHLIDDVTITFIPRSSSPSSRKRRSETAVKAKVLKTKMDSIEVKTPELKSGKYMIEVKNNIKKQPKWLYSAQNNDPY